jgi:hypothetical protein
MHALVARRVIASQVGAVNKKIPHCCVGHIDVGCSGGPAPPPVYQGQYDPKALYAALKVFVCQ